MFEHFGWDRNSLVVLCGRSHVSLPRNGRSEFSEAFDPGNHLLLIRKQVLKGGPSKDVGRHQLPPALCSRAPEGNNQPSGRSPPFGRYASWPLSRSDHVENLPHEFGDSLA
jgi:hypothetical protein